MVVRLYVSWKGRGGSIVGTERVVRRSVSQRRKIRDRSAENSARRIQVAIEVFVVIGNIVDAAVEWGRLCNGFIHHIADKRRSSAASSGICNWGVFQAELGGTGLEGGQSRIVAAADYLAGADRLAAWPPSRKPTRCRKEGRWVSIDRPYYDSRYIANRSQTTVIKKVYIES